MLQANGIAPSLADVPRQTESKVEIMSEMSGVPYKEFPLLAQNPSYFYYT